MQAGDGHVGRRMQMQGDKMPSNVVWWLTRKANLRHDRNASARAGATLTSGALFAPTVPAGSTVSSLANSIDTTIL